MTNSEFGKYFCDLRKKHGLSQKQLAEQAQLSVRAVRYWELGEHQPHLAELWSALRAIDASLEEQTQAVALLTTRSSMQMTRRRLEDSMATGKLSAVPDLGDLLRAMRLRRGWTREYLAATIGVSLASISRWEMTRNLPSKESLLRLCKELGAADEEQAALCTRRMLPQGDGAPLSLEMLEQRTDELRLVVHQPGAPLVDLLALTLKRQLWNFHARPMEARRLIAMVDTYHSWWLHYQGRSNEVEEYTLRALERATPQCRGEEFLAIALNLAALCAVEEPARNPEKGIRVLRTWLPQIGVSALTPALYCDMAVYAAEAHRESSSEQLLDDAYPAMIDQEKHTDFLRDHYGLCRARVLLHGGRAAAALQVLPPLTQPDYHGIFYAIIQVQALLAVGDYAEAARTVEWVYSQLETYPSTKLRKRVESLAQQL